AAWGVAPGPALELVSAGLADHHVVPGASGEDVVPGPSLELVAKPAAAHPVIAGAGEDEVEARLAAGVAVAAVAELHAAAGPVAEPRKVPLSEAAGRADPREVDAVVARPGVAVDLRD